jgi:leucyl/phenylalanyl-tRNA--protein transferase
MARTRPTRPGSATASEQRVAAPTEPPRTQWQLPDPTEAADDIVGLGADLEPGTILAAYRSGLFPMRVQRDGPVGWWSPDPRGILPLDGLHVSRSLRRSCRRFDIRVDTAFDDVIRGCADPARPSGWIDDEFIAAYARLHELGWVHSVEVWSRDRRPELAGGVYGVAIGGLFAGESMFHRRTDASKVALVALVDRLRAGGATLFDVQWLTDHLASLGAREISRARYLGLLADAVSRPQLSLE